MNLSQARFPVLFLLLSLVIVSQLSSETTRVLSLIDTERTTPTYGVYIDGIKQENGTEFGRFISSGRGEWTYTTAPTGNFPYKAGFDVVKEGWVFWNDFGSILVGGIPTSIYAHEDDPSFQPMQKGPSVYDDQTFVHVSVPISFGINRVPIFYTSLTSDPGGNTGDNNTITFTSWTYTIDVILDPDEKYTVSTNANNDLFVNGFHYIKAQSLDRSTPIVTFNRTDYSQHDPNLAIKSYKLVVRDAANNLVSPAAGFPISGPIVTHKMLNDLGLKDYTKYYLALVGTDGYDVQHGTAVPSGANGVVNQYPIVIDRGDANDITISVANPVLKTVPAVATDGKPLTNTNQINFNGTIRLTRGPASSEWLWTYLSALKLGYAYEANPISTSAITGPTSFAINELNHASLTSVTATIHDFLIDSRDVQQRNIRFGGSATKLLSNGQQIPLTYTANTDTIIIPGQYAATGGNLSSLGWLNGTTPVYRLNTGVLPSGYAPSSYLPTASSSRFSFNIDSSGTISSTFTGLSSPGSSYLDGIMRYFLNPGSTVNPDSSRKILRGTSQFQIKSQYSSYNGISFVPGKDTDFGALQNISSDGPLSDRKKLRNGFNVPMFLSGIEAFDSTKVTTTTTIQSNFFSFATAPALKLTVKGIGLSSTTTTTIAPVFFAGLAANAKVEFSIVQPKSTAFVFSNTATLPTTLSAEPLAYDTTSLNTVDTEGDIAYLSIVPTGLQKTDTGLHWVDLPGSARLTSGAIESEVSYSDKKSALTYTASSKKYSLSLLSLLPSLQDGIYGFKLNLYEKLNLATGQDASGDANIVDPTADDNHVINSQIFRVVLDGVVPNLPTFTLSSNTTGDYEPGTGTSTTIQRLLNSATSFTNNEMVRLSFSDVSDATSGVKKIYLFNDEVTFDSAIRHTYQTLALDTNTASFQLPAYETNINTTGAPVTVPDSAQARVLCFLVPPGQSIKTAAPILWKLRAGADGQRIVRMITEDQAGNLSIEGSFTTGLYTTPVDSPDVTKVSRSFSGDRTKMIIAWQIPETAAGIYNSEVQYQGPDLTVHWTSGTRPTLDTVNHAYSFSREIDLTQFGTYLPNALVTKNITVTDNARNSGSLQLQLHTPADLAFGTAQITPTKSVVSQGTETITYSYKLLWAGTNSNTVLPPNKIHVTKIELLDSESNFVPYTGTLPSDSAFVRQGTTSTWQANINLAATTFAHAKVYYRAIALNSDATMGGITPWVTEATEYNFEIPNTNPLLPVMALPRLHADGQGNSIGYLGANGTISFQSGDADSDTVRYHLLISTTFTSPSINNGLPVGNGAVVDLTPGGIVGSDIASYTAQSLADNLATLAANSETTVAQTALGLFSIDGAWFNLTIQAVDSYGVISAGAPVKIVVDTTAPGVSAVGSVSSAHVLVGQAMKVHVTIQESGGRVEYQPVTGTIQPNTIKWTWHGPGNTTSTSTVLATPGTDSDHLQALLDIPATTTSGTNSIPTPSGSYSIDVTATDWAGNETTQTYPVILDRDSPEIRSLTAPLSQDSSVIVANSNAVYGVVTSFDGGTGIQKIEYAFVDTATNAAADAATWRTLSGSGFLPNEEFSSTYGFNTTNISDGARKFVVLKAYDLLGNVSSNWFTGKQLLVDRRVPSATLHLNRTGSNSVIDINYLPNLAGLQSNGNLALSLVWDAAGMGDLNAASCAVEYALQDEAGVLATSWNTSSTGLASFSSQTDGARYSILARLVTQTGVTTFVRSEKFVLDDRAPSGIDVWSFPGGPVGFNEDIQISVHVNTSGSPIQNVSLWIEDQNGNRQIVTTPLSYDGTGTIVAPVHIPQTVVAGNYQVVIFARDHVGHVTEFRPSSLVLAVVATDHLSIQDGGPFVSDTGALRGTWDFNGSSAVQSWRYRLLSGTSNFGDWQAGLSGQKTMVLLTGPNGFAIQPLTRYQWEVEIVTADARTISATSSGFVVDLSAPDFDDALSKTPQFSSSSIIPIGWSVLDAESGISTIRVQLRTPQKDSNGVIITDPQTGPTMIPVSDWVTIPASATQISNTIAGSKSSVSDFAVAFSLNNQPLDVSTLASTVVVLQASNRAGLLSETSVGSIVFDASKPPVPVVVDSGSYFNPNPHGSNNHQDSFRANWTWTQPDPESGSSYAWAVSSSSSSLRTPASLTWHVVDGLTDGKLSLTLSEVIGGLGAAGTTLPTGTVVFLAVRAANGAGLVSYGMSDGQIVDNTLPSQPSVAISYVGGGSTNLLFMNPTNKDFLLDISTSDIDSGVQSVVRTLGTLDPQTGAFAPLPGLLGASQGVSPSALNTYVETILRTPTLNSLSEGTILAVKVDATDVTGNVSSLTSEGVYIERTVAGVGAVNATTSQGLIDATWSMGANPLVLAGFNVQLQDTDSGMRYSKVFRSISTPNFRFDSQNTAGIQDAHYIVLVSAVSRSGVESPQVASNLISRVTQPATFNSATTFPRFADHGMSFLLSAVDRLSGIESYQFIVGNLTNPFAYQSSWNDVLTSTIGSTVLRQNIDFANGFISEPAHNANAFVYYRVRNGSGIWSPTFLSSAILIDHTKPTGLSLFSPDYATNNSVVPGNTVTATDQESGLTNIRYLIRQVTESYTDLSTVDGVLSQTISPASVSSSGIMTLPNFSTNDQNNTIPPLAEMEKYRIVYQIQNGAGTWSDVAYGSHMQVDTTPPSFAFDGAARQVVTNDGTVSDAQLEYTMSSDVKKLSYRLALPDGTFAPEQVWTRSNLNDPFHPYYQFNQTGRNIYTLKVHLVDKAGWTFDTDIPATDQMPEGQVQGTARLTIRYNAFPEFNLAGFGSLVTTPGNPEPFTVESFLDVDGEQSDSAGNKTMRVTAYYQDGTSETHEWVREYEADGTLRPPVLQFTHPFYHLPDPTNPYPQVSMHWVGFVVTDGDGLDSPKVSTLSITRSNGSTDLVPVTELRPLTVINTQIGRLYANEFWAGPHTILGNIRVPQGLTLTVLDGSQVTIRPNSSAQTNFTLGIEGILNIQPNALFKTAISANQQWNGIHVLPTGFMTLNDATIEAADRGIVLSNGGNATINQLAVVNGNIGIHLLAGTLPLSNSTFQLLREYGIKTEGTAKVQLTNSQFIGTPRVYYENTPRTVLSLDELNQMPGSGGNTSRAE